MRTIPSLSREMTSEDEVSPNARFASGRLPWIVGAAGLVVYLLTLNYWMSFASTAQVAKASGWAWQPEMQAPLNWLLTLPFRLLPASLVPTALNLFSAALATVTLMLLGRSVALLPHDRTMAQRERQRDYTARFSTPWAWIPPVFAVLLCGLQISFWESATNATTVGSFVVSNSMLDLALFAYVVRCLLEYRLDERASWLIRSAFIFGLGMTNDWAMIGFLPLFVAAMIWVAGMRFFSAQLLTRLFLAGAAGLLLYLLLPIVMAISDHRVPFWYAVRYNLGTQRYMLLMMLGYKVSLLPIFFTALVPLFWMGIRWPNSLGDTSARGTAFAKILFHFVHAFFLLTCAWIALDPPASPRNQQLGVRFLSFYYLGALSAGYFLAYFLLIFGPHQPPRIARREAAQGRMTGNLVTALVLAVAVLVPALLTGRNLPQIRQTNGPMLREYAERMAAKLPDQPALIMSDDLQRAMLIEAARATSGRGKDWVVVVSSALKDPPYHRYLKERYGPQWAFILPDPGEPVGDPSILNLVSTIAETRPVYYLQPSFGYFFETRYLEPRGLVYQLQPYPEGRQDLQPPALPEAVLQENLTFWQELDSRVLGKLSEAVDRRTKPALDFIAKPLRLRHQPNRDLALLGSYYSRAINHWGVELQRLERLKEATPCFERALELNPDNLVAQINLESNRKLAATGRVETAAHPRAEDAFRGFPSFDQVVTQHGPFDDPFFCNAHGQKFYAGNNFRQAGQLFLRATELDPKYLPPYLSLGLVHVLGGQQDRALEMLKRLRQQPDLQESLRRQRAEVLYLETMSHLVNTNEAEATKVVRAALATHPGDSNLVWAATMVFMGRGLYAQAMEVVNDQLPRLEYKATTLLNKGWLAIQLRDFELARETMDQLIASEQHNTEILQRAYLNRAIALLELKRPDEASEDYLHLQKNYPDFQPLSIYYGLGEIAYRKQDTNAAIYNYELYLKGAARGLLNEEEMSQVQARLKDLKPGPK